jgi:glutamate/tyrosine decarboxylase-like PLP-dependent enzyme
MSTIDKIKELELLSKKLEPGSELRKEWRDAVSDYAEDFLNNIENINAYVITEDKGRALLDAPIGEPKNMDFLLDLLRHNVDRPGLNPASGGHLGYIPGGGLYPSALGDYLADIFNRYAGMFFGSPGAVRMENQLIKWLSQQMGYPESAAGNLSSGGSIANQIALCTARDANNLLSYQIPNAVIYTSAQVHHCVHKAINMVGLKETVKRNIALDDCFRMRADDLKACIIQDVKNGLKPFMVIASAGTTDVGAVDPLDEIADICEEFGIWFHVDAAYGGFFKLVESSEALFKGIERSDSLVIDPHKGLFLPYGTGAVLVRNGHLLFESQHLTASYLQDAYYDVEEVSPADLSPELTKHFRGLRLWMPLQLFGIEPFKAALEEKLWLTRYFYEEIQKMEGFEVGPYPELSVMVYRYVPKSGNADEFNARLVEEVKKDGSVFLSSTMINGTYFIRLAVLSFRTHLSTIDSCLSVLKEKVEILKEEFK